MRVVVTGATSMIGAALIKACIQNRCEVLAIVRPDTWKMDRLPVSGGIKIEYADLDNLNMVTGDGKDYDVFYHLAWGHTIRAERDLPIAQEDNIRTTLMAVELAHKLGCKKFVGAGSQAEYGFVDTLIDADTRPDPVTSYGMAKLSANMLSRRMCEQLGMEHIWGRIFSVYGTNDKAGTMIDYAARQFMKGEKAEFSAGTQMWNFLYEDDAGEMLRLLGCKDVPGGIYCIASDESRILKEYILELAGAFDAGNLCSFATDTGEKTVSLDVDTKKTTDAIGYRPRIKFMDGVEKVKQLYVRGGVKSKYKIIMTVLWKYQMKYDRAERVGKTG